MTTKQLAAPLLVTLALAAAGSASATGEPKNMPPFTRPASARALTQGVRSKAVDPPIQGEPKNEWPFTRPASGRALTQGVRSKAVDPPIQGEPKNEWPFTRPVSGRALTQGVRSKAVDPRIQGEPKNEPPFTRPVEGTTIVVGSSGGFDWTDGAIGLAAGIGLALSLAGGTVLVRTNQRRASPAR